MKAIRSVVLGIALVLAATGVSLVAQGQAAATTPPQSGQSSTPPPTVKETVVVSASRSEQQLVNAPATMTVIDLSAITLSSAINYADILRTVPGVNVSQISARDINVTSRASTSSLATTQLTLLDGRSLYQDFFGFTMWDFMPVNVSDIKRIEVVRGPASAVWGANAMNGVINVITKSPRENPGTTVTLGFGGFPRGVSGNAGDTGWLYYMNAAHAQALNDRWAYRVSGGAFVQDAMPRPIGIIPGSPASQPYPAFQNEGTSQPKADVRFDYDFPDHVRSMSFSGGFAGTTGIMHSGIGPFSIDEGSAMSYGKFSFNRNGLHVQAFLNVLDGDATSLLTVAQNGLPIPFAFNSKTFDIEAGDSRITSPKNVVTYGGNLRSNHFDLSIAPDENGRTEGGAYVQDEFAANKYVRLVAGARVDKFTSIDSAVFSPRVAFLLRPQEDHTVRISYNRAFRAPSMINNNLDVTIANALPLTAFGVPGSFLVPTHAIGNPDLTQEHVDAYEVSYTGIVNHTTISMAYYVSWLDDEILFTQTAEWPTSPPPPGWPLPAPFWAAAQASAHFPQEFSYRNLGLEKNQGFEFGVDSVMTHGVSAFLNFSLQRRPVTNFSLTETNLPAKYRFNSGVRFDHGRWNGSFSVASSASAFFQDVLDARFSGTTRAYTVANLSFGGRFGKGRRYQPSLKINNIGNVDVQQHIFGDVLKRQIVGELRVQLPK